MPCIAMECYVTMSDGVKLYTTVQLPASTGRFPIMLVRSPYVQRVSEVKNREKEDVHGYAVVCQHCRGCGMSEGDCIPYVHERQDGLDTLEWLRKQTFYDGEIYLNGGSYLTSVHLAYLSTYPADVKGAVLAIQDCIRYNVIYRNGFYKAGLHGGWAIGMYKKNSITKKNFVSDTFKSLPLKGFTKSVFGEENEFMENELKHPDPADDFWQTLEGGSDAHDAMSTLQIPVLLATSFFDIYTEGIFDMWDSIPEAVRSRCALVVTPYNHTMNYSETVHPVRFPNGGISEAYPDYIWKWLDHIRLGTPMDGIHDGETMFYRLWENQWHHAPRLENGTEARTLYLNGDQTLAPAVEDEKELTYVYNPYAPASFKGGLCLNFGGMAVQDPPDSRYDIVSFVAQAAEKDCVIEGTMDIRLRVRTDCPDTCFYVRLSVDKDGVTFGLRDDIMSVCYQHPDYAPGQTVDLRFHFGQISFLLSAGDRLRLDVSSSCMPYFVPHTNRKGLFSEQTGADIAHNTIVTGAGSSIKFYVLK